MQFLQNIHHNGTTGTTGTTDTTEKNVALVVSSWFPFVGL